MVKLYFSLESLDVFCRKYLKVLCTVSNWIQTKVVLTIKYTSVGEFHLFRAKVHQQESLSVEIIPSSYQPTSSERSPGEQIQIDLWGMARGVPSGGVVEIQTTGRSGHMGTPCEQTDTTDNVENTFSQPTYAGDNNLILGTGIHSSIEIKCLFS